MRSTRSSSRRRRPRQRWSCRSPRAGVEGATAERAKEVAAWRSRAVRALSSAARGELTDSPHRFVLQAIDRAAPARCSFASSGAERLFAQLRDTSLAPARPRTFGRRPCCHASARHVTCASAPARPRTFGRRPCCHASARHVTCASTPARPRTFGRRPCCHASPRHVTCAAQVGMPKSATRHLRQHASAPAHVRAAPVLPRKSATRHLRCASGDAQVRDMSLAPARPRTFGRCPCCHASPRHITCAAQVGMPKSAIRHLRQRARAPAHVRARALHEARLDRELFVDLDRCAIVLPRKS